MYVCLCRAITDEQIRQAMRQGATSVREVNLMLGRPFQCGACAAAIVNIIEQGGNLDSGAPHQPESARLLIAKGL